MITEDYISFETAKLLKEKGFDVYGDGSYNSGIEIYREYSPSGKLNSCVTSKPHEKAFPAPTLQMAMKYLREVHHIAINIGWGEVLEDKFQWWCIILNQKEGSILRESEYYATYEEACESAIKYCLENLI